MKKTYIPEDSLSVTQEAANYYKGADSLKVYKSEEISTNSENAEKGFCAHCNSDKAVLIFHDRFRHITGGSDHYKYLCSECNCISEIYYER